MGNNREKNQTDPVPVPHLSCPVLKVLERVPQKKAVIEAVYFMSGADYGVLLCMQLGVLIET